mmetsp:Transcript_2509/g.6808  ORF Transcript_2509/g.6808 Transcript_2509/m.6808 type:complete len:292 (-) Transcript_2509:676-1551(-)|eukprot:CAMPEP_0185832724 /NCGR_PEP_ID=MMETSP1353-20130828/2249_1 /TAXON_ID=1077150 /ORGANISM="Erythrolobus australicus, Strain CCMP3124" /LENGTH=291 /DNA_ID=CAMNT_0028530933 /DNA_START=462 /DNA_END=1337 /DNA_ORIENTATION=+
MDAEKKEARAAAAASKFRRFPVALLLNHSESPEQSGSRHAAPQSPRKLAGSTDVEGRAEEMRVHAPGRLQRELSAGTSSRAPERESDASGSHNNTDHADPPVDSNAAAGTPSGSGAVVPLRKRWTAEEDQILRDAVERHGPRHWDMIASFLPGRNGQHARLRYNNYVRFNDDEKSRPFLEHEDRVILAAGFRGAKWCSAAKELGRSNNAIKNRFHLLKRKLSKEQGAKFDELFISPILEDPMGKPDAVNHHSRSGSPSASESRERMDALFRAPGSSSVGASQRSPKRSHRE